MKTVMLVFGTRPEAIKMCPLIKELKSRNEVFRCVVCVTGQHREMLDQVLRTFQVVPDYDLSVMRPRQTLSQITAAVLERLDKVLDEVSPDTVLVHGDTGTTFAAALACFYRGIAVGHVEAGLRTYRMDDPFPEEFNRRAVGLIAAYHFAPTEAARANLLREGTDPARVYVTGNTAIDALLTTVRADYTHPHLQWAADSRLLILTAHRRENLGEAMRRIFCAVRRITEDFPAVKVLYPVHKNPIIRELAARELADCDRIRIIDAPDVLDFHNFLARCEMILTDSGGIQEEAPSLGKPVLVLRKTTERPEGVAAGTLKLVGTDGDAIYENCKQLLTDHAAYRAMAHASNPYGDGHAARRIAEILQNETF